MSNILQGEKEHLDDEINAKWDEFYAMSYYDQLDKIRDIVNEPMVDLEIEALFPHETIKAIIRLMVTEHEEKIIDSFFWEPEPGK